MKDENGNAVSRAQVEQALWKLTGFTGDQLIIDGVLTVVDAYVAGMARDLAGMTEPGRESYYHALVTMAETITDAGVRDIPADTHVNGSQPVWAGKLQEAVTASVTEAFRPLYATVTETVAQALKPAPAPARVALLESRSVPARKAPDVTRKTEPDEEWDGKITCKGCGDLKEYTEYYRDGKGPHGRKTKCKECERAQKRLHPVA